MSTEKILTRSGKKEGLLRQERGWIDEEVQLQSLESWCIITT